MKKEKIENVVNFVSYRGSQPDNNMDAPAIDELGIAIKALIHRLREQKPITPRKFGTDR
jgi:hypothetical protein